MPTNQTEYTKDSTKRAVWLIVGVPGTAAPRIPDLERAMRDFAERWIKSDSKQHSPTYDHEIGVAETEKLRIFVQER